MPYNFTPLEYNPYAGTSNVGPRPAWDAYEGRYVYPGTGVYTDTTPAQWDAANAADSKSQFQGYTGNQFQSLFDAVNSLGASPFVTGQSFGGTPQFNQLDQSAYGVGDDFDQQAYNNASMGNMRDYMGQLGSFFQTMGATPDMQNQINAINNSPSQGPALPMPQVGGSFGVPPQGGNNPFPQFTPTSGGWGQAPTSLFGAGAGNTGVGQ